MVSIIDVARLAEVSQGTVSRVIRNHPSVRPATRRVVMQAIAELGYVPNTTARNLRNARSNTIGLVIPDLGNWGFHGATQGITAAVRRQGYALLLCDSEGRPEVEAANLRRLYERRVEGLILGLVDQTCEELQLFLRAGVPMVLLGWWPAFPGVPQLSLNRRESLQAAVNYLAGLGHRRIGIVNVASPGYHLPDEVHREVVTGARLPWDASLVCSVVTRAECVAKTVELVRRPDRPTAVISGGQLAPYVLEGIYRVGLEIPEDLSFVSLSDSPWAAIHRPPITAVSYDNTKRGSTAVEYIVARIDGRDAEGLLAEARSEIRVRKSCAPAAGEAVRTRAAGR